MNYLNIYLAVSATVAILLLAILSFIAINIGDLVKEAKAKNSLLAKIADDLDKKEQNK